MTNNEREIRDLFENLAAANMADTIGSNFSWDGRSLRLGIDHNCLADSLYLDDMYNTQACYARIFGLRGVRKTVVMKMLRNMLLSSRGVVQCHFETNPVHLEAELRSAIGNAA